MYVAKLVFARTEYLDFDCTTSSDVLCFYAVVLQINEMNLIWVVGVKLVLCPCDFNHL